MKKTTKVLSLLLSALLLLSVFSVAGFAVQETAVPEIAAPALKFGEDGKFTILHLTDTQDDQYPAHELKPFLTKAIEQAQPDLIVFTGDLVEDFRLADFKDNFGIVEGVVAFGLKGKDKEKTHSNAILAAQYVLSFFEESGVPFAMVQGNNDYKVNVSNEDWKALYATYSHCLTNDMSDMSAGIDYRLPIYGADGKDVKLNVYCLDSGEHEIDPASLDWYVSDSNAQKAQDGTTTPAFAFQHIPVDEVGNFFEECKWNAPGASPYGFKSYKLTDNAHGYFTKVYQSEGPSDEFAAWKQQGDIIAAFFGHMHTEGYSGTYDGIELNLTYGCEFAKSGPYGMRVITLSEDDVTGYQNQSFTYEDGMFKPDSFNASEKTLLQKIKLFFASLLNIVKLFIRKVLPV